MIDYYLQWLSSYWESRRLGYRFPFPPFEEYLEVVGMEVADNADQENFINDDETA